MHKRTTTARRTSGAPDDLVKLVERYGCGPVQFTGADTALYERHLLFDNVVDPARRGPRERFEAFARSVRDVLSQRWVQTEETYERENPKRVYYLSMEFLIGRSLANNVTNLLLDPVVEARRSSKENLDWPALLEQEPDAGLGNGGLGRLAACFLDSMATMQLPAMGYGLRYEYGIFKQSIRDGWQQEQPDNWLRRPDPWEVARPDERVEVKLNCSFELRGGRPAPGHRPAVEPDRHPVRSAGRRLRRQDHQHAPALGRRRAGLLRLSGIQQRRFRRGAGGDAGGRIPHPGAVSRRLDEHGAGAALRPGVLPGGLLAGRPRAPIPPQQFRLGCASGEGRHPAQRHAPGAGRPRADADPARRRAARMGSGLGPHAADPGLHQPHAPARSPGEMAACAVRGAAAASPGDHLRDQSTPAADGTVPLSRRRGARRPREP